MSISLQNVHFAYGNTVICDNITWELPSKGVVCLWGASGCGKTTLMRLLAGLERPQSGTVNVPTDARISVVFQEDRLIPWKTVWENAKLASDDTDTVAQLLKAVGLDNYRDSFPNTLSGGQQRRAALVRALAAESDVLLLDEPFNGLDEETQQSLYPLIRKVAVTRPVVLITHIAAQAEALGADIIPLSEGPLTGVLQPARQAKEKI